MRRLLHVALLLDLVGACANPGPTSLAPTTAIANTVDYNADRAAYIGELNEMKDEHFSAEQWHNVAFFGLSIIGGSTAIASPLTRSDTPKILGGITAAVTLVISLIRPDNRAARHNRCVLMLAGEATQFGAKWGPVNAPGNDDQKKAYLADKEASSTRLVGAECVR